MAIESQNADYNLTTAVSVYNKTATVDGEYELEFRIGDGAKNLNAGVGTLTFAITNNGNVDRFVYYKDVDTRVSKRSRKFFVARGTTLSATLLSSNSNDTDVDVTVTPRTQKVDLADTLNPTAIADLKVKLSAVTSHLSVFFGALQNAATAQVPIVIIGDSTGEGSVATNPRTNGWAYLLKSQLQATYGDGGLGYLGAHRTDLYTWQGAWTGYSTYGLDGYYSANASSIVTISAQTCSSFQVIVIPPAGNTFDASVDGGAYQTYSTTAFGTSLHRMGTVPCGSLGNHTLAIRGPAVSSLYFYGVVPVVGTTGVVVHNQSITGTSAPHWTGTHVGMCPGFVPKLWIISLGINDAGRIDVADADEPDVATFITKYQSIVTQAVACGASVLLMNENPTFRTGGAGSSDAVQASIKTMAASNGTAYINITELWPSYAAAVAAGLMNDTLHPSTSGHLLIGKQMISALMSTGLATATTPVVLADAAIKASTHDNSTSHPVASADTGDTQLLRKGAGTVTGTTITTAVGTRATPGNVTDAVTTINTHTDTAIAGLAGTGARSVTITVKDEPPGPIPLEGAKVRVTKGAESYVRPTNISGQAAFSLDDGTWTVAITLSGYSFTPTTLVVDGTEVVTYYMSLVSVPASDPGLVTGYYHCYDKDGVIESGAIVQMKFHKSSGSGISGDVSVRSETSGVDGLVSFTNLFTGADYMVRRGTDRPWHRITIDADATTPYALPDVWGEED